MASVDVVPTMSKFAWKRGAPSVSRTHKRPCPIARENPQKFWVVGKRSIPCYDSSPWNFYEPFVGFESGPDLVLCNDKNEIQVITPYTPASNGSGFSLLQIQHQNFVDIYELYSFEEGSVCPTEPEIVCIISQVLTGIRFIWSRNLDHQLISVRNIRVSRSGNVKIDPTIAPEVGEQTSADLNSLGTVMLKLMGETRETLNSTALNLWSAEAINFVEATSSSTPDELSDVSSRLLRGKSSLRSDNSIYL